MPNHWVWCFCDVTTCLEQNEEKLLGLVGCLTAYFGGNVKNRRKKKTTAKVKQELLERLTKRQQERSGDDLRRSIIHRAAHPPPPLPFGSQPLFMAPPKKKAIIKYFS